MSSTRELADFLRNTGPPPHPPQKSTTDSFNISGFGLSSKVSISQRFLGSLFGRRKQQQMKETEQQQQHRSSVIRTQDNEAQRQGSGGTYCFNSETGQFQPYTPESFRESLSLSIPSPIESQEQLLEQPSPVPVERKKRKTVQFEERDSVIPYDTDAPLEFAFPPAPPHDPPGPALRESLYNCYSTSFDDGNYQSETQTWLVPVLCL